jgi:hypothetical protein
MKMKTIKKMGFGLLSLTTLFFASLSNGFPKSRIIGSLRSKIEKIMLHSSGNSPEALVLQQTNSPFSDELVSNISDRSHTSHRSHASHRSGTTGRVSSKTAAAKPTASKATGTPAYIAAYLTAADVEKVTSYAGVQQKNEGAFIYFLSRDNKNMLQVKFSPLEYFDNFVGDISYKTFRGLGDSALISATSPQTQMIFKKGENCVTLTTFSKDGTNLFLSVDQLASIGQIIASRI